MGARAELNSVSGLLHEALLEVRLLGVERKYNPEEPRVPAGSPEGGRWTDDPSLQPAADRRASRQPIDLRREEAQGGHAIARHVGLSNSDLVRTLQGTRVDLPAVTYYGDALGTFNDLPTAERYVNDVLDSNQEAIDNVSLGKVDGLFLEKRYDSPTGREAYRVDGDPDGVVKLQPTFSVGVYIQHVAGGKGFYVRTAYPKNKGYDE